MGTGAGTAAARVEAVNRGIDGVGDILNFESVALEYMDWRHWFSCFVGWRIWVALWWE